MNPHRNLRTPMAALLLVAVGAAFLAGTAAAHPSVDVAAARLLQPSSWPSSWTLLDTDPDEPGCNDHRNVTEAYVALDASYLYLRLVTVDPAGWPSVQPQGQARYKWFIDVNGDASTSGGSVLDAEYQLLLEDLTIIPDPTLGRNLLGELTLLDDLANGGFTARWDTDSPPKYTTNSIGSADWRRVLGTGVPGSGGPQGSMTDPDIGYQVIGNEVLMYVSLSAIGDPSSIRLLWATDNHDNNLDQAPNCDRMDEFLAIPTPTATPTPTDTPTPGPSPTGPTRTPTPTSTPGTVTPTPPGGNMIGGFGLERHEPAQSDAAVPHEPGSRRVMVLALLALLAGGALVYTLSWRE